MGKAGAEAGTRSSPRWPWVAESHLPPVLLWCTFRKVKRIAERVAIDSDVSDSETKEAAQNSKALYPKLPKTQVPTSLQDAELTPPCTKWVEGCGVTRLAAKG